MKKYGGKHNSARSDNNMRASMKRKTIRSLSAFFASIFVIPAIFCTQSALGYYDEPGVFYKVSDKIEWLKDHTLRTKLGPTPSYWGKKHISYCIESSVDFGRSSGDWKQELDKDYRIAAEMIKTSSNNDNLLTQTSIAFAMHDHFDLKKDEWKRAVDNGFEKISTEDLKKTSKKLWEEAENNTPMNLEVNQEYTSGKHAGVVHVRVKNIKGYALKDVPIRLESEDALVEFNDGKQSVELKSKDEVVNIPWSSKRNGTAIVKIGFLAPKAERYYSPEYQDEIRSINDAEYSEKLAFGVKDSFQPTLTSKVAKHELHVGEKVDSTVTSGVLAKDSWLNGVTLRAQGYYFVGSAKDILQIRQRNNGESAVQYLKRIRALPDLRQVAAAKADFSKANESVNAKAKRANGDISASDLKEAEDYKVADNEAGLFGTWVWIISRDAQKKEDADKLDDEVVKVFGSADSTSVYQATISSDVVTKQKIVGIGTEIVSEITVRGLPETYGSFKGNETYGFNADKKAHIRVWWAGEGSEKSTKKDNEKYMPGSKGEAAEQEPKEDAHHHLIGNWEVPAVNGVYKVGNGSITMRPIAGVNKSSSDPKVLKDNVHIRANKNSESGWYVFVYDFPGSSRALAHKSAYNGLWSRALVEPNILTTPVSVTTRVSDEKVKAGEKFHDNARITGTLPKGSYVVFSAYEYEDGKENKSDCDGAKCSDAKKGDAKNSETKNSGTKNSNSETKETKEAKETKETKETAISVEIEKKMPQSRVNITDKQAEESKKSSISVSSADITLDHEGTIYWKAEVYDAQGNPLATHVLGVEGETVQVSGGEDRSKNDKNDGNDEHDANDEKNEETLSNETDGKNSNENKENGKESKEKVEENHSKTGSDETVNSDDLTDSKNDGNDHTSNQHVGTNSNENASKNYVNQSNTIPTSLAVTGASSVTVILLAVIMLTFASGLSLGRFSAIVPKHGRMSTGARHSEIPPMRRRLVR